MTEHFGIQSDKNDLSKVEEKLSEILQIKIMADSLKEIISFSKHAEIVRTLELYNMAEIAYLIASAMKLQNEQDIKISPRSMGKAIHQ